MKRIVLLAVAVIMVMTLVAAAPVITAFTSAEEPTNTGEILDANDKAQAEKDLAKGTEPDGTYAPIITIGADVGNGSADSLSAAQIIAIVFGTVIVIAAVVTIVVVKRKKK